MASYELTRDDLKFRGIITVQNHENVRVCRVCRQRSIAADQPSPTPLRALVRDLYLNSPCVAASVVRDQKVGASHIA
jgi:hypothetical protein